MRRRITARVIATAALAATVPLLSGCGSGGLVPVDGVVTLNGEPIEGAAILFSPTSANKEGSIGTDSTGPEGNFRLSSAGRSGIVPGKYNVLVTKEIVIGGGTADRFTMVDEDGNEVEDPYMAQIAAGEGMAGSGVAAPETVKAEEVFEREVPADGATFDFDLKASSEDAAKLRAGG